MVRKPNLFPFSGRKVGPVALNTSPSDPHEHVSYLPSVSPQDKNRGIFQNTAMFGISQNRHPRTK
jgi:hypothetical protein